MTASVLIADDEAIARRRTARLLRERSDVDIVAQCAGGAEAVSAIREHEPDLVLLDIQMPGMSGADLQAQLIAEGNFTPMIFITAFDNEKIRARVLKAGAYGYLKKPFDEKVLVLCLENALKTRGIA